MSGHRDKGTSGQLALMDAMIFFAASLLISSIVMSQAFQDRCDNVDAIGAGAALDASSILGVLLRTSIGRSVPLDCENPVAVQPTTTVGECMAAEAVAILSGEPAEAFADLNGLILAIAELAVSPGIVPHLWIMLVTADGLKSIVRIEERPPVACERHAASFDLPAEDDARCFVTLVLEPATLGP